MKSVKTRQAENYPDCFPLAVVNWDTFLSQDQEEDSITLQTVKEQLILKN